jgi:serine/threonine protein kinase
VYLCQNTETNEEFALKVIPRLKVENTEDFNKEIGIMKKLNGPNIVKLHKVLASANNFY